MTLHEQQRARPVHRLAKVRRRLGLSQEKLAKASKVNRTTISYIESGGGCTTMVYEKLHRAMPNLRLCDVRRVTAAIDAG